MDRKIIIDIEVIKEMHPESFNTPEDIAQLGCDYWHGDCVEQNYDIARVLFEEAVEMGYLYAMTLLGDLYHDEEYEVHDDKIAFEWYMKAATNGELEAGFMVGVFFDKGFYVKKDETMAFYQYKLLAYHGVDEAQYNVAVDYAYGIGVTQDYKLAVKWYQLACKQGNTDAMNNLGIMYKNGVGVEKDENQAFQLVMASALEDNTVAMKNLGYFYKDGVGCQRNATKAMEWFLKAKKSGEDINSSIINMGQLMTQSSMKDPALEYQIAEYYRKGEGVSRIINKGNCRQDQINRFRNYKRAAKWYIRAAKHDKSDDAVFVQAAYYKVGTLFEEIGNKLYEDYYEKLAVKYYMMAAEYGLPIAYCKLGGIFEKRGEEKKAMEYYNRASDEAYFKYSVKAENELIIS